MSDYSNYSVSDYDDLSEEDNNAGAYGGYDDLYDDVMEEAGYDAWDIGDPEFDFDEERHLFEFDPFSEYFDLKDPFDMVTMTYQSLLQMTEMTNQLFGAWKKRSSSVNTREDDSSNKSTDQGPFPQFGLNLYQLDHREREELRSYSVWKVLRILGGDETVSKFAEKVEQIEKYLRRVLLDILGCCLPPSLPYPVISTILSHLLAAKGLASIGQVSVDDPSNKVVELDYMDKLYLAMADVFDHLKIIMFNIEPNTLATEPTLNEKKENLFKRFEQLSSIVDAVKLKADLDGLKIRAEEELGRTASTVEQNGEI